MYERQEARKAAQAAYAAGKAQGSQPSPPSLVSTLAHTEFDEHGLPINAGPEPVDRTFDVGALWRARGR